VRRREFITLLGGATAAWPAVARAQPGDRRPLVGYLVETTKEAHASRIAAFLEGMRDLGYIEGQNVEIVYRFGNFDRAQVPALAEELVRLSPHLIVAADPIAVLVVKSAAPATPVVCALLIDPIKAGLARSLARPGGTVTGTLTQVDGLMGKQVELVRELMPHATTVGVLVDPPNQTHAGLRHEIEAAASAAGMKVVAASASSKAEIAPAFQKLSQAGVQAVIVPRDGLFLAESGRIAELARAARVPTAHSLREETEAGGLISYGVNVPANFRRAAYFVDKILQGAKPADLPIEFPTRLELIINLKTAKALGLDVPPTLLARADEVIE
jgi:putative tryptophan/tyrosine transport system substrate-binding protein